MAKYSILKGEIHTIPTTAKQHAGEIYFVGTLLNKDCPFSAKQPKLVQFGEVAKMYKEALDAAGNDWSKALPNIPDVLKNIDGVFESWVSPQPFYLKQMAANGKIVEGEVRKDVNGQPILYNKLNPFVMYYFDSTKQQMLPIDGNDVATLGQRMFNRLCVPASMESAEEDIPYLAQEELAQAPAQEPAQEPAQAPAQSAQSAVNQALK